MHVIPKISLRPAGSTDEAQLFEWANLEESRRASLESQAPISWDEHRAWLADRMTDSATRIWIVEVNDLAVGQVRFQDKGNGPEVALYIEPSSRRTGLARRALALALVEAAAVWPSRNVIARVRPENTASRRLFESARFMPEGNEPDELQFTYALPAK